MCILGIHFEKNCGCETLQGTSQLYYSFLSKADHINHISLLEELSSKTVIAIVGGKYNDIFMDLPMLIHSFGNVSS